MSGPAYDLLVVAHVLSAVIGFGAVGASGLYASRARSLGRPQVSASLRRYFAPGRNWAARSLLLTPVLGGILLGAGDRPAAAAAWPWIGLGVWLLAAAVVSAVCWPAERAVQAELAREDVQAGEGEAALRAACRRLEKGAAVVSVLFVVALVVMIAQPG